MHQAGWTKREHEVRSPGHTQGMNPMEIFVLGGCAGTVCLVASELIGLPVAAVVFAVVMVALLVWPQPSPVTAHSDGRTS